jgi:ribonuclease PH
VQGTAEGDPFSVDDLQSMLGLAQGGCTQLAELQRKAIAAAK